MLLFSLFVGTVAHFWFALTNDITQMFVARIVAGLAAGNIGVIQAIIADKTSPEDRARTMGLLGAAIGSGFVLSPGAVLGGIGSGPVHQVPFLIRLVLSFVLWSGLPPDRDWQDISFTLTTGLTLCLYPYPILWSYWRLCSGLFLPQPGFCPGGSPYVLLVRDLLGFGARQTAGCSPISGF